MAKSSRRAFPFLWPRWNKPTVEDTSTSSTEDVDQQVARLWLSMKDKESTTTTTTTHSDTTTSRNVSPDSIVDTTAAVGKEPTGTTTVTTTSRASSNVASESRRKGDPPGGHWYTSSRKTKSTTSSTTMEESKDWKAAVDSKTGRTYYYNKVTRVSQWKKPLELASNEEREEMILKEAQQREFFEAMEANILKNLQTPKINERKEEMKEPTSSVPIQLPRPNGMVRTISAMDETVLREIVEKVPSAHRKSSLASIEEEISMRKLLQELPGASSRYTGSDLYSSGDLLDSGTDFLSAEEALALRNLANISQQMSFDDYSDEDYKFSTPDSFLAMKREDSQMADTLAEVPSLADAKPVPLDKNLRRNTCSTMYVSSTLAAPDKDASIKCVCGVYRAHILQSAEFYGQDNQYLVFDDQETVTIKPKVPSLDEITSFYRDVYRRSQMEADCIIMSLIYVERLIKVTEGGLRPRPSNWRSILFSCMVLASKVNDDLSMWNVDFSQTCPSGIKFTLQRINQLEIAILSTLNFKVKVKASEYAKYYFLLRSMLIKSGLAGDDVLGANPLDIEGAKRLEHLSSQYQHTAQTQPDRLPLSLAGRSKSMTSATLTSDTSTSSASSDQRKQANLEQIVKM